MGGLMLNKSKSGIGAILGWIILIGVAFCEITLFFSISNVGDGGFWMNLVVWAIVNVIAIMVWAFFFNFIGLMGSFITVLYLIATLVFVWFVPIAIIFGWW